MFFGCHWWKKKKKHICTRFKEMSLDLISDYHSAGLTQITNSSQES